jgi:hypothetical protein
VFITCMFLAEQGARYSMSRTVARSILIAGRKTSACVWRKRSGWDCGKLHTDVA